MRVKGKNRNTSQTKNANTATRPSLVLRASPPVPSKAIEIKAQTAKRIDSLPRIASSSESERSQWLGPILMVATLAFMGLAWFYLSTRLFNNQERVRTHSMNANQSASVEAEEKARIQFYQNQIGYRLNQKRVDVELQNFTTAPAIEESSEALMRNRIDARSTMMYGAPLMPENYGAKSYRDRTEFQHPDHPDARVHYGLQDEQDRLGWQQKANSEFIKEYIENARKEGYDLVVDKDLNVVSVKRRANN